MNEKTYANKLLEILTRDEPSSRYFKSKILEINGRLIRWNDEIVRIGLVGVTSSGKSTLLNALLGEAILPTAVRPSSGTIIICSKGVTTKATILFENGEQENVPEKDIVEALNKYGDEINNVNNKYNVKEIHLQSNKFLLPKHVQIIDSPGLDAYGLERHEELTLSTLLPTIDLCLYVVTFKTNSDDITYRILHQINEQHKPMIIIQNMLDSVVPKIGINGLVEKSRAEIAKEHFIRTKRILDSINPSLHEIVQVIQLSAKRAIDAQHENDTQKMEESQLHVLLEAIEKNRKGIKPQLFRTRGASLLTLMESLLEEESTLMNSKTTYEMEIQRLEAEIDFQMLDMDKAKEGLAMMENSFKRILKNFTRKTNTLLANVESLDAYGLIGLDNILLHMKKETSVIEDTFLKDIKQKHEEITKLMHKYGENLNEILRTLVMQPNAREDQDYLDAHYVTVQQSKEVKESGIAAGAKRFFGAVFRQDWGYVTEYEEVDVIDKVAIEKNIKKYKKVIERDLKQNYTNWAAQLQSALSTLQALLHDRRQALNEKRVYGNQILSLEERLIEIRKVMEQLKSDVERNEMAIQQFGAEIKNSQKKVQHTGKTVEVQVDKTSYDLYKMSKYIMQEVYNKCRMYVENENKKYNVHSQTIIVGWDEDSLVQFVQRYFQLTITDKEQEQLNENGVLIHGNYCMVYGNQSITQTKKVNEFIAAQRTNGYIIADVAQVGQAKKQINRSPVIGLLKEKGVICNIVMQSFTEFMENKAFDEALEMFDELKRMVIFNKGMRLVNDVNPIFTLMHLELDHSASIIYDATKMTQYIQRNMQYLIRSQHILTAYQRYLNALTKGIGAK